MKPAQARSLLNCSYTTLRNYEKAGKLKLSPKSGKTRDYDDLSVYELYDQIIGRKKCQNTIIIIRDSKKEEFVLDEDTISQTLDFINMKIKQNLNLNNPPMYI